MPLYVARATVTAELPTDYGDVLSNNDIDAYIGKASLEVDELVGKAFTNQYESNTQKFPEITDSTNTTPATVETCALWLTLARCFANLEEANRHYSKDDIPAKVYWREQAEDKLEKVRDGDIDLGVTEADLLYATEKYPDDESSFDRTFTNTECDNLLAL